MQQQRHWLIEILILVVSNVITGSIMLGRGEERGRAEIMARQECALEGYLDAYGKLLQEVRPQLARLAKGQPSEGQRYVNQRAEALVRLVLKMRLAHNALKPLLDGLVNSLIEALEAKDWKEVNRILGILDSSFDGERTILWGVIHGGQ